MGGDCNIHRIIVPASDIILSLEKKILIVEISRDPDLSICTFQSIKLVLWTGQSIHSIKKIHFFLPADPKTTTYLHFNSDSPGETTQPALMNQAVVTDKVKKLLLQDGRH